MSDSRLAVIACAGRRMEIEYAWAGADAPGRPVIVFLHEGLGSVSAWRDFPHKLCAELGLRGLVWSRPGYGRSTPRGANERWAPDFMHRQALETLPALLETLGVAAPYLLFGHSDGASIALIHAAQRPRDLAGLIVMAPHLFVEEISITSIEKARRAYLETDLRARLARHHTDPDSAFWGWNDVWLDPSFRDWNIEALVGRIDAPVLAIQGVDDEYGTMRQIDAIAAALPGTMLLKLERCGHSPHRDRPDAVIEACEGFVRPILANRAPARSL